MRFVDGLLTARSHIAFLVGLGVALAAIAGLSARGQERAAAGAEDLGAALGVDASQVKLGETGRELTPLERAWAETAFRYFENNYQRATGLVNSVDQYPSTTLWDLGSYAMGLYSALELGLIDEGVFDARVAKLLETIERLPLVEGALPNKAYNTVTLAMVDYNNAAAPRGIGWSALDIARIGVPFTLIAWRYPKHTPRLRRALARWRLDEAVHEGALQGARRAKDGALERVQEGRFGYEQYGAKSLSLLGQDASRAARYDVGVEILEISGQAIASDARLPERFDGAHNAVLSEPYILEAIEFGLTRATLPIAAAVYGAQRNRYAESGVVTAVTEDNLDKPPYFVYSSVVNGRRPWATFAPNGASADESRTLSVKAAMGFSYVFGDGYARALRSTLNVLCDPARGWYSGRYEEGGAVNRAITANTNGIVLEILLYRAKGPLLKAAVRASGGTARPSGEKEP